MKKPTISEIKAATQTELPHFFDRSTLKFFGQSMKSFTVAKSPKGNIFIHAPIYRNGFGDKRTFVGYTFRQFINGNDLSVPVCNDDLMTNILTYIHNN